MLSVKLICVGKMRERHYIEAFREYEKRLGAFCRFELVELAEQRLPENPSPRDVSAALEREGAEIGRQITKGAFAIAMCVEGKRLSSEDLAQCIGDRAASGVSRLCFVVGGSCGLAPVVKARADLCLSMSDMTFPHHLARVMLAEQIYRAFTILGGSKYHK